jgi:CubicO group peptidase (beta-lactamase class C family)
VSYGTVASVPFLPCALVTRCRVPRSLESVTSVRAGAEVNSREIGAAPDAVARIWGAVESLYRSGIHPAIALCVRRHGEVLIDRAIGHVSGNGPYDPPDAPKALATPDTPFGLLSATKAVTAMIIHLLDQRNLLRLDDPICEYIPEFAVRGKQWITIRHVLTHRAGLPSPPREALDLDVLGAPERIVEILCEMPLASRPGRQLAYHAVTGGFILGEIVRRITGESIRAVHDESIRRPLGFRWMRYGLDPEDLGCVAVNYFTGLPALPPVSLVLRRALGVSFYEATALSNDPRFLCGVIPAASMVATANELCRFYQLLLNDGVLDGVRVFAPRTIRRATAEQSYLEFDFMLGLPVRYGMGFMLGGKYLSFYGPDTPHAFGHLGFTNVISWADPERRVAAALMTSGKPLFHPALYHVFDLLRQIETACPRVRSRTPIRATPAVHTTA